jgi:hypothetical protein
MLNRWAHPILFIGKGNIIGAHTINHIDLNNLSAAKLDYEIGQPKICLTNREIFLLIRAIAAVVDMVSKYFDIARYIS